MQQWLAICLHGLYLLGKFPGTEELCQRIGIFLMLTDSAKSPFKGEVSIYNATTSVWEFPFPHALSSAVCLDNFGNPWHYCNLVLNNESQDKWKVLLSPYLAKNDIIHLEKFLSAQQCLGVSDHHLYPALGNYLSYNTSMWIVPQPATYSKKYLCPYLKRPILFRCWT